MRRGLTAACVALSVFALPLVAPAQDAEGDLNKLVQELAGVVGKLTAKHVAEAQAKLEAELAARDARIKDLEARLRRLEDALVKADKKDDWPAKELTGAYLAVGHTDVPADLAARLKVAGGALVTDVIADGPAAAAGLERGDVIVSINDKAVSSENLQRAVGTFPPGTEVRLGFVRDGRREDKAVRLADKEEFWAQKLERREPVVLGLIIEEDGTALTVKEVDEGFTGSVAGLKVGDRLTQVNGNAVTTLEEVGAALGAALSGDRLDLTVMRGEETLSISVIGGHDKGQAKLLASKSARPEVKEAPKPQKKEAVDTPPAKKSAYLGVDVEAEEGGPAVVSAVLPDTTASAYGLKPGDIFTKVGGADVPTADDLVREVGKLSAGQKITLVVSRGGKNVEIKDVVIAAEGEKVAPLPKPGLVGIVAEELEDRLRVRSLVEGGAASQAGIKPEDVIVSANGKAIKSFDDLEAVLKGLYAGDVVMFKVRRGDQDADINVTLAPRNDADAGG